MFAGVDDCIDQDARNDEDGQLVILTVIHPISTDNILPDGNRNIGMTPSKRSKTRSGKVYHKY